MGVHFGSCCLLWCWFVALLVRWFDGFLVCWLVALLVFWFVGCLFAGCLAPESKARGRAARRAVRSGAPEGVCCVGPETKSFWNVDYCQTTGSAGRCPDCHRPQVLLQLGPTLALSWSNLAVLSVMFVHLVQLGSYLAPTWSIFAPTWPNFPPTWPNLVPSWPNLAPTWSNFGPNLVQLGPKI